MGRTFVVVKTTFPSTHALFECSIPAVSFLASTHRHLFYVTVKWEVTDPNRQKEFFTQKALLENFIEERGWRKHGLGSMSCEMVAREIAEALDTQFVSVYEDNENGAEFHRV